MDTKHLFNLHLHMPAVCLNATEAGVALTTT